ncbi:MAG: DnaJ domain-containing protein [Cyanobacteria bacterium P01_H01_bin.15]
MTAEYYQTLGLQPGATEEEIHDAYRRLAKRWHPDCFVDDPEHQALAEQKFKDINLAYQALKHHVSTRNSAVSPKEESSGPVQQISAETYYQQGMKLSELEDFDGALEQFSIAIRLNPNFINAYKYRGFICSRLGFERRADADLRKAARLEAEQSVATKTTKNRSRPEPSRPSESSPSPPPKSPAPKVKTELTCVKRLPLIRGQSFALSPSAIATIELPTQLLIYNTENWLSQRIKLDRIKVTAIALNSNGQTLAWGAANGRLEYWRISNSQVLSVLSKPSLLKSLSPVITLAISPNRQWLICARQNKDLEIWQLSTGRKLLTLPNLPNPAKVIAISPNSRRFVTAGLDPNIRLWDLHTGKFLRSFKNNGAASAIAFSPDGDALAAGGYDRDIIYWRLDSAQRLKLAKQRAPITDLRFKDWETIIFSTSNGQVEEWSLTGSQVVKVLVHSPDTISKIQLECVQPLSLIVATDSPALEVWQKA